MRGRIGGPARRRYDGVPPWFLTFGDLMALLLTFFILLVSFSRMEPHKYQAFSGSVMKAFGVQSVRPVDGAPLFSGPAVLAGLQGIAERVRQANPGDGVDVEVFEDYRGIVLRVGDGAVFEAGRSAVRPAAWALLDEVTGLMQENAAQVQIEAHTDSTPPASMTNERLSAARALAVVHYLRGRAPSVEAARLEAAPMADTHPIAVDSTDAGRRRNRRLEIVFHAPPRRPDQSPWE